MLVLVLVFVSRKQVILHQTKRPVASSIWEISRQDLYPGDLDLDLYLASVLLCSRGKGGEGRLVPQAVSVSSSVMHLCRGQTSPEGPGNR